MRCLNESTTLGTHLGPMCLSAPNVADADSGDHPENSDHVVVIWCLCDDATTNVTFECTGLRSGAFYHLRLVVSKNGLQSKAVHTYALCLGLNLRFEYTGEADYHEIVMINLNDGDVSWARVELPIKGGLMARTSTQCASNTIASSSGSMTRCCRVPPTTTYSLLCRAYSSTILCSCDWLKPGSAYTIKLATVKRSLPQDTHSTWNNITLNGTFVTSKKQNIQKTEQTLLDTPY